MENTDEKGRFIKGNKAAQRWSLEQIESILEKAYENVLNNPNEYLSLNEVFVKEGIRKSHFDHWMLHYPQFKTIRDDIKNCIISHINRQALENKFNPTQSIWRQKQLGEKDEKNVDVTSLGEKISITPIEFND